MSLAASLAAAQVAFPVIAKTKEVKVRTKTGGEYTFKYAPLDDVLHGLRPILNANGLAISQLLSMTPDGRPALRTLLLHEGGESLEDVCPLPVNGGESAQELGSAITYLRRYAVVSILGIATEEDDDGNAASGNTATSSGAGTPTSGEKTARSHHGEVSTPAPDNPAAAAQAAAEAAKAARTPADGGHPSEVVVHFGKNSGTPLGSLSDKQLAWYAETWEPQGNPQDRRLKLAAQALKRGGDIDDFWDVPFA